MRQVGVGNNLGALVANVWYDFWTFFQKPLSSETESSLRVPSPYTRTKLFIWTPNAPGGVASRIWTVRRNNATVLVLTMTGAEQEIRWSGSIPFALADIESMQYTESGSPTSTPYYHVGWEIETVDDFTSVYVATRFELQNDNRYIGPLTSAYGGAVIANGTDILAMSGSVVGATATVSPNVFGTQQWQFRWVKNGVLQDGTGGTVDTTMTITQTAGGIGEVVGSFVLPLSAGDLVSVEADPVGSPGTGWAVYSTMFQGTIPHQSMFPSAQGSMPSSDRYSPIRSAAHAATLWSVPDALGSQSQTFDMAFTLSDFWSWVSVAPGVGNTRTLNVRVTGIDTALSVAQTGATQTFSDVVHTADVPAESVLNLHGLLTGAPENGTITINLIENTEPQPVVPTFNTATRIIRRMRRTPHLSSENLRQFVSKLELEFQRGVGLTTGQGSDPQIMLRWSKDGGQTWSNEHWTTAGTIGSYARRAIWRRIGAGRDFVFEVTMTDPVLWCLLDAYLDVDLGDS